VKLFLLTAIALLAGCAGPQSVQDAGPADSLDAGLKAETCASTFGSLFTNAFGRADGTVTAVVPPTWQCPLPNADHIVIQVSMNGVIQRLVVNVKSDFGDPNVLFRTFSTPLPAPAYEEGWHTGVTLDFVALGLHSDSSWESLDLEHAAARVYDAVQLGAPLSVYATSTGGTYADSAHKVHRNGRQNDGAIIVNPMSEQPTWLLFHFANQTF
jgi:hypothetical protein